MDALPEEAWQQLDSAIAHITAAATSATFDPTTAVAPPATAEEASPWCPASDCSSEYDTAWVATANLTQLEAAAEAMVAAPAPATPTAHPSSDDTLAAALDTIATQDVVLSTPRMTPAPAAAAAAAAAAAPESEWSHRRLAADVAAGGIDHEDWESASPPADKVRAKRLFVPDSDEDAWDAHAAAQPLSGDTLVIPETPTFAGNTALAAAGESDQGVGTGVRRGNTVRRFCSLMYLFRDLFVSFLGANLTRENAQPPCPSFGARATSSLLASATARDSATSPPAGARLRSRSRR